ncbi:uncharacterized protein LOC100186722 [Ciona intestinalis]
MTPEVVGAFTSEHGETFRQFSSNGPTACQYVFSVDSAQCESNGMKTKILELQSAFRTVQSQLNAQENRLHQAERFIREIQERLNINRPTEESRTEYATTGPQKSGAGDALVSLSEIMQTELVNLEIQIDDAEKRRVALERENSNLTTLLVQSRTSASELRRLNNEQEAEILRMQQELTRVRAELHERRTQRIDGTKRICGRRVMQANKEKARYMMRARSMRVERIKDQERLANATARIEELQTIVTSQARNTSSQAPQCNNTTSLGYLNDSMQSENVTTCGRLTSISEPITFRKSKTYLGKLGAWMKDPAHDDDRVYVINIIGENQVRQLYEYPSITDFGHHQNEYIHLLPHPMESNGAVVYNGSLYYQRRNSRKIVRYDMAAREVVKQRPIKQAGFHGTFAYLWGGFTDIDLAVDETGLWVIYSTLKSHGNIMVGKINPVTLRMVRPVIRTNIQKRGVANAFIICQVLYTVNSYSDTNAYISYSYDLNRRIKQRLKIPFKNLYKKNVMIDYNPRNRYIYAWDDGYQVAYKSTVDKSGGRLVNGRIIAYNGTFS